MQLDSPNKLTGQGTSRADRPCGLSLSAMCPSRCCCPYLHALGPIWRSLAVLPLVGRANRSGRVQVASGPIWERECVGHRLFLACVGHGLAAPAIRHFPTPDEMTWGAAIDEVFALMYSNFPFEIIVSGENFILFSLLFPIVCKCSILYHSMYISSHVLQNDLAHKNSWNL